MWKSHSFSHRFCSIGRMINVMKGVRRKNRRWVDVFCRIFTRRPGDLREIGAGLSLQASLNRHSADETFARNGTSMPRPSPRRGSRSTVFALYEKDRTQFPKLGADFFAPRYPCENQTDL